ncbi:uncharacterized protein BCR38DRAFT_464430 [Pseudomassariella vexata]|uniref:NAD(P)-binding domain-containing protein n=1 Tax=Pseudomassariella vexata TaxID=1141098 RepID=A0A1Y2E793_9PEZI|nr:uncharacterized protein BCR38DRAFT_464430 [Pseudomassariella vexata]ORY67146.1 hypothetical protein BCR38DRAFT_464430 [Pseudomassariella vexata]
MEPNKATSTIRRVAVFGASGNFGTPITAALSQDGCFDVTIITRVKSRSTFLPGLAVIRTAYTVEDLTKALEGQDAVVCAVAPSGVEHQVAMVDAAEAAGVKRFIVNDFGWGLRTQTHGLPEFRETIKRCNVGWDYAAKRAEANPSFTWTGITTGKPIDWALRKFPAMGFDVVKGTATIYDAGDEVFTGTMLEGIGQSVVGVLRHPDETANRFVKARSINTCQNELLQAFQKVTGRQWPVTHSTTEVMKMEGGARYKAGAGGWTLYIAVAQLLDPGKARNVVAPSREESDADLLGIVEETPESIAERVLKMRLN